LLNLPVIPAEGLEQWPHHRLIIRRRLRRPIEVPAQQLRPGLVIEGVHRLVSILQGVQEEYSGVQRHRPHIVIVQERVRTFTNQPERPDATRIVQRGQQPGLHVMDVAQVGDVLFPAKDILIKLITEPRDRHAHRQDG
jgi:hypothetical protein